MTTRLMNRKFIQAVKVVSARLNSIIVDIIVLHSASMTSLEAFHYFLENVKVKSSDRRSYCILK